MSQNIFPPVGPGQYVPPNELSYYPGPAYTQRVSSRPDFKGPDYVEPSSAQHVHTGPGPNRIMYTERGVDWIHSGRYPLSRQPGFQMQHNFMLSEPQQQFDMSAFWARKS